MKDKEKNKQRYIYTKVGNVEEKRKRALSARDVISQTIWQCEQIQKKTEVKRQQSVLRSVSTCLRGWCAFVCLWAHHQENLGDQIIIQIKYIITHLITNSHHN